MAAGDAKAAKNRLKLLEMMLTSGPPPEDDTRELWRQLTKETRNELEEAFMGGEDRVLQTTQGPDCGTCVAFDLTCAGWGLDECQGHVSPPSDQGPPCEKCGELQKELEALRQDLEEVNEVLEEERKEPVHG